MKTLRLTAFSLTILFHTFVFAQINKPQKVSFWIYDYTNVSTRGPLLASYNYDSIIDGSSAMVLEETLYSLGDPSIDTIRREGNIILIEDSVVKYWNYNRFDTLYNFGAEVGDKWNYYFSFSGEDTLKANVLEKGEDQNLGAYLTLQYSYGDASLWEDTIYERVLGGSGYFIPWGDVVSKLDGHRGGPLKCFSNSSGRYSDKTWTNGGVGCTDILDKLSINEIPQPNIFSIYPNPSRGSIQILGDVQPQKMEAFNALGKRIYSSKNTFYINNLPSQMCFVKIWRNDGSVEVHKVLVE